jgi:hypothetical protein
VWLLKDCSARLHSAAAMSFRNQHQEFGQLMLRAAWLAAQRMNHLAIDESGCPQTLEAQSLE